MKKLILAAMIAGVSGGVMAAPSQNLDAEMKEIVSIDSVCGIQVKMIDEGDKGVADATFSVENVGNKALETLVSAALTVDGTPVEGAVENLDDSAKLAVNERTDSSKYLTWPDVVKDSEILKEAGVHTVKATLLASCAE